MYGVLVTQSGYRKLTKLLKAYENSNWLHRNSQFLSQNSKKFLGRGPSPFPRSLPRWGGGHPLPTPLPPRRLRPLDSRLWRSNSAPTAPRISCLRHSNPTPPRSFFTIRALDARYFVSLNISLFSHLTSLKILGLSRDALYPVSDENGLIYRHSFYTIR